MYSQKSRKYPQKEPYVFVNISLFCGDTWQFDEYMPKDTCAAALGTYTKRDL